MSLRPKPASASQAHPQGDGRLHSPSFARNGEPIAAVVAELAPARGRALELASGSGEHVLLLSERHPDLIWQPSDAAPERIASVAAWLRLHPRENVLPPLPLDATAPGWAAGLPRQDLVMVVNLLHLISTPEAQTCLAEMAAALAPGGVALIYGPFRQGGRLVSEGDRRFDASLRAADPETGYKDAEWVNERLATAGLVPDEPRRMPADNLILAARRPG
ncbi:class I SAM-dependent methyltransferase [Frigidibacter sp. ROC022]|uniref:class I SAM-dependent methyltransferase n=1 Tax=Frigidibacter sp. ROC022 TaxID=2971796 RepID=UPI00215B42A5|nr:class I SAM-dependent methyltransferase [Frigidibacter sp. ROC022]MCR8722890.1 class I SAM-dependent methyltransferase [Frigidibacter sp. ROC022]